MKKIIILMVMFTYTHTSTSKEVEQTNETSTYLNLEYGKIGWFDQEEKNSLYGLEFQNKDTFKWNLDAIYGLSTSQENNKYFYFGINKDWHFKRPIVLSSSLSVGLFDNNQLIDLGHTVEFRTKFTIAYRFKNDHRLGLSIAHLSNSRLSNENPGTEILSMNYIVPLKSK